jgi:hypothetical protein
VLPVQLEELEVSGSDYVRPLLLGNFRGCWETLEQATEREDDYGLGPREHLQVRLCSDVLQCMVTSTCTPCLRL